MSTYTQILYQIVFSTKNRKLVLVENNRKKLYKYMGGIIRGKGCHLYQIGGVENHLHIITHIHPMIPLAQLVKDIKLASTSYIKEGKLFPGFEGWQNGYGAFTYDVSAKEDLIAYVKNQKKHHKLHSLEKEYKKLLLEQEVAFVEKYLF